MCLAIPGKIIEITGDDPLMRIGKISFGGALKDVSLAYLPDAKVGDYALIHVGFALSIIDEKEALKIFEYFKEMGELADSGKEPA